jgi:hypothetical protein
MDRATLEQHLAEAERHIVRGEKLVTQQQRIVVELERYKFQSALARELLTTFEKTLAQHIAHRDWIRKELGLDNSGK